ncbi:hypothetical protein [Cellulomonas humilata]|uniref:hypothetical protein n=1 Tax=Cellulomonas humilata TaxID=144055 RepID=UPI001B356199|nr:hypothetical protein [Cellulomonas humilata]
MHRLAAKNKYVGFLFMKISPEYFALGRKGIHEVSVSHADDLSKFSDLLTHVVTSGLNGKYDQITIVEADTLEQIHAAATEFRMGAKAAYIDVVDVMVGIKAPPRKHGVRLSEADAESAESQQASQ